MKKLYVVRLSEEERSELTKLVKTGRAPASTVGAMQRSCCKPIRDNTVLRCMIGRSSTSLTSPARRSKRCANAVTRKGWKRRQDAASAAVIAPRCSIGEGEAQLVAIACSEPPDGRARWTLHLLLDELKRRKIVQTISHETVRKVLKKRDQAVAPTDVVHSAPAGRRLRVRDGASPGGVHPPA